MLLYLLIMGISLAACFAINAVLGVVFGYFTILYAGLSVIIYFALLFGMDALIALIIHKLPQKWFNPYKRLYAVSKKECSLLRKIGILRWKDIVPEMGQLCNFKKDKIQSINSEYLMKFLIETCYAEVIHWGMALSGIVTLLICPFQFFWNFSFPLFMVNFLLQIPPMMIQRFNRPRLLHLYEMSLKREKELKSQTDKSDEKNVA